MKYLFLLLVGSAAQATWVQGGCKANVPEDKKGSITTMTDSCGKPAQICTIPLRCLNVESGYLTDLCGFDYLKTRPPAGSFFVSKSTAICKAVDGGCPPVDECRVNPHDVQVKWDERPPSEVFPPGPGDENGVIQ